MRISYSVGVSLSSCPFEQHEAAGQIDGKVRERQDRLVLIPGRVADGDADAGEKLPHAEGFRQIIVRPRVKGVDLVRLPFPYGKDDDGRAASIRAGG